MGAGYVTVDEGRIDYDDVGHGARTIVWIHGLPLNGDAWRAQIDYFAPRYRNVAIDLRGYGRSSKLPAGVASVTDLYVSDLERLFARLNIARAIPSASLLAGTGRFVFPRPTALAWNSSCSSTPRRNSVVEFDWPWGFDETAIAAVNDTLLRGGLAALSDLILDPAIVFQDADATQVTNLHTLYRQMSLEAGVDTIAAFFNNIAQDDDRRLLPRVTAPTLLITGSLDREVPPAVGIFMRQQIPKAHLMEIPGGDHFVFATKAGLVNCMLEQFFANDAAAASSPS